MPALPNLLVIGAAKSGTSSLHRYLGLHPEIEMSDEKELNYFLPGGSESGLLGERSTRSRGEAWYAGNFRDAPVRGESSVAYSFPWFGDVASEAVATLGEAETRIIYLVREPLSRMLSHLDQYSSRDSRAATEALSDPESPYVQASRYRSAVDPFIAAFGRERVLIVRHDELLGERERGLAEVFGFLGVDASFRHPGFAERANVSSAKGRAYRVAEHLRAKAPEGSLPRPLRRLAERLLSGRKADGGGPDGEPGADPRLRLDPPLRADRLKALEPEIAGIEELTGWDLAAWRADPPQI